MNYQEETHMEKIISGQLKVQHWQSETDLQMNKRKLSTVSKDTNKLYRKKMKMLNK